MSKNLFSFIFIGISIVIWTEAHCADLEEIFVLII